MKWLEEKLGKLFDSQVETLMLRGCPQAIMEAFQNKRDNVIAEAAKMEIPENHIPFVPVIPAIPWGYRYYMESSKLMGMVRYYTRHSRCQHKQYTGYYSCHYEQGCRYNTGPSRCHYKQGQVHIKTGHIDLLPNQITDNVETPEELYFIYGVEDGKDTLGESLKEAEKFIKEQNRSCLTASEGIALCIHTDVLSKHWVDCAGSRQCHLERVVPAIIIYRLFPMLEWDVFVDPGWRWGHNKLGSASCRIRA